MADLVDPTEIEELVGARRHHALHIGRADTKSGTFYILHSQDCLDSGIDLTECRFSVALDMGVSERLWAGREDKAQIIAITDKGLFPGGDPLTWIK